MPRIKEINHFIHNSRYHLSGTLFLVGIKAFDGSVLTSSQSIWAYFATTDESIPLEE